MTTKNIWVILRVSMGFIFLWAFLDKAFGLGFSTPIERSWLNGSSPTTGYLTNAVSGLFADNFRSLAGSVTVDWLFMLGLLFVGTALLLGIATRLAGYIGALMMFLIFLSVFPPSTNPLIDDHVIYILVLLGLSTVDSGSLFGVKKWWKNIDIVKKCPILQ